MAKMKELTFAINTNKQSSIKCSPYMLMFGRNALEQCNYSNTVNQITYSFETSYGTIMSKFEEINKTIKTNIKSAQEKQKIVYEKRMRLKRLH